MFGETIIMQISTVLFDLDGTLLDSAANFHTCLNQMLLKYGLTEIELAELKKVAGMGANAMLRLGFAEKLGDYDLAELEEEFLSLYLDELNSNSKLFPGINELLMQLEDNQLRWGIVTNKKSFLTNPILVRLNLLERASSIVCGDSVEEQKPSALPILHACKQIEVEPENCVYVGNSKNDILAGKAANTKTIAVNFDGAHIDYTNWQADHCCTSPKEILAIVLNK